MTLADFIDITQAWLFTPNPAFVARDRPNAKIRSGASKEERGYLLSRVDD